MTRWHRLALLVVFLGFCLRVHDLGQDALWYDEVLQLQVATAPTFRNLLRQLQDHAMALPLDYTLTRFTAAIGGGEFFLRFPALLWGTLSLALVYRLGRRVAGPPAALLGTLLTAGWALHVRFSQELRNYASLGTLYLLGALVLVWALQHEHVPARPEPWPRLRIAVSRWPLLSAWRWLVVGVVFWIGSYFHSYVLFAFAHGGALWLAAPLRGRARWRAALRLAVVVGAVGVLFLPGYYFFGRIHYYAYPLYEYGRTFWRVVSQGLGWVNINYANEQPLLGLWEVVAGTGLLSALAIILRQSARYRWLAALMLGTALQVLVIYWGDVTRGYWFLSRQLVHLGPLVLLTAAAGLCALGDGLARLARQPARRGVMPLLMAVLIVAAAPVPLGNYYAYARSTARELSAILAEQLGPGEPVYVIPAYDWKTYAYYLKSYPNGATLAASLRPIEWAALEEAAQQPGPLYLAVNHRVTDEQLAQIAALGFTPLYQWPGHWLGAQSLFVRKIGYN